MYKDEYEVKFDDKDFSSKHIKISADEFALAYILAKDQIVKNKFGDGLSLAIERCSVQSDSTVRNYKEILKDTLNSKTQAKELLEKARKELENYAN